jgi:hypothetical protein
MAFPYSFDRNNAFFFCEFSWLLSCPAKDFLPHIFVKGESDEKIRNSSYTLNRDYGPYKLWKELKLI